jgi:hypothetical protein
MATTVKLVVALDAAPCSLIDINLLPHHESDG